MTTLLVCGGRDFTDESFVYTQLDAFHKMHPVLMLIQGGCPTGADHFAKSWAIERKIPYRTFVARWKQYGKAAGPIRNQEMLDEGSPDYVMAFPGNSGTSDMVRLAQLAIVPVIEVMPVG
jgi:hypothetical protein